VSSGGHLVWIGGHLVWTGGHFVRTAGQVVATAGQCVTAPGRIVTGGGLSGANSRQNDRSMELCSKLYTGSGRMASSSQVRRKRTTSQTRRKVLGPPGLTELAISIVCVDGQPVNRGYSGCAFLHECFRGIDIQVDLPDLGIARQGLPVAGPPPFTTRWTT
jgi:hypothetical protein